MNSNNPIKKCGCGLEYYSLPDNHKTVDEGSFGDGVYFNCECRSTLFIPKARLEKIMEDELQEKIFGPIFL